MQRFFASTRPRMTARRLARLTLLFAACSPACAEPVINDWTPAVQARNGGNNYFFSAAIDVNGTTLVGARAAVSGIRSRLSVGRDLLYPTHYGDTIPVPGCAGVVPYHFEVDYQRPNDTAVYTKREPEIGGHVLSIGDGTTPPGCSPNGSRYVVSSTADLPDANILDGRCAAADGRCTLRAAIANANITRGHDLIELPEGEYVLGSEGSEGADVADISRGDLDITDGLTIRGQGFGRVVIDGNRRSRLFDIYAVADDFVRLDHLILRNGRVMGPGGAIFNRAALQVTSVGMWDNGLDEGNTCANFSNLRLCNRGGAIYNEGELLLTDSTIERSSTCGFAGCTSSGQGGAISNYGAAARLIIERSSIANNAARFVGGVHNLGGFAQITNTTFDGNVGHWGASITNTGQPNANGRVLASSVTIRQQSGPTALANSENGQFGVNNSIIGFIYDDGRVCTGNISFGTSNFIHRSSSVATPMVGCRASGTPPLVGRLWMGPLAYGGYGTATITIDNGGAFYPDALRPIDSGGAGCPYMDQNHNMRPKDGDGDGVASCDSGAVEKN